MIDRNLIVKNSENFRVFLNTMQKLSLEIPYHYREIVKNEKNSLSYDVNNMFAQSQILSNFVRI